MRRREGGGKEKGSVQCHLDFDLVYQQLTLVDVVPANMNIARRAEKKREKKREKEGERG